MLFKNVVSEIHSILGFFRKLNNFSFLDAENDKPTDVQNDIESYEYMTIEEKKLLDDYNNLVAKESGNEGNGKKLHGCPYILGRTKIHILKVCKN